MSRRRVVWTRPNEPPPPAPQAERPARPRYDPNAEIRQKIALDKLNTLAGLGDAAEAAKARFTQQEAARLLFLRHRLCPAGRPIPDDNVYAPKPKG